MINTLFPNPICLYCHNDLAIETTWVSLLSTESQLQLCNECTEKLEEIKGETCNICSRPLKKLTEEYIKNGTCYDCIRWEEDPFWNGCLQKNISIYQYNDFLKELISQFKFRGDYILAKAFSKKINEKRKQFDVDLIVPIPLSKERLYERGFNQSTALIKEANLKGTDVLTRTHSEKQSKKSRQERLHERGIFQLKKGAEIKGKSILLIDDIYTTGATLRHAAKILIEGGAASVSSLTLARG